MASSNPKPNQQGNNPYLAMSYQYAHPPGQQAQPSYPMPTNAQQPQQPPASQPVQLALPPSTPYNSQIQYRAPLPTPTYHPQPGYPHPPPQIPNPQYPQHIPYPHASTSNPQQPAHATYSQLLRPPIPQPGQPLPLYTQPVPLPTPYQLPPQQVAKGSKKSQTFKGTFQKDLATLMYGFGDEKIVAADTVNVMEEIVIEYITDLAQAAARPTRKNRLTLDDIRRALSHPADAKKLARMEELLFMQEDIKRARAQFDENEEIAKDGE